MGQALVLHLLEQGINVVAYNRSREKTEQVVRSWNDHHSELKAKNPVGGIASGRDPSGGTVRYLPSSVKPPQDDKSGSLIPAYTTEDLVKQLKSPRVLWLMVEHGKPVDDVIAMLLHAGVQPEDVIIDGGNSFFKDSQRRFRELAEKKIHFLDVGTSGGIEGARHGACMMIGGEKEIYERLIPFFTAATSNVASPIKVNSLSNGTSNVPVVSDSDIAGGRYTYFGPAGAGHFVKMVHNGVEYGMLQAIGEGFAILEKGPYPLDLHAVAQNWTRGSVVRGWLMDLLERALKSDHTLSAWEGVIGGGSTGEWTTETAKEEGVDVPVIEASMEARKTSQTKPSFSGKVVAALRHEFGGHVVETKTKKDERDKKA